MATTARRLFRAASHRIIRFVQTCAFSDSSAPLPACDQPLLATSTSWPLPFSSVVKAGKPGSAKQGAKTFLLKMPVVGENFGQPFPEHRLHRNAIRQAVALVGPRPVELQPGKEGLPALRNHLNNDTR